MNDDPVAKPMPAILTGLGLGALAGFLALILAFLSMGAGHGDYFAARALFPFSMLLTLVEGSIGTISLAVGLIQFPLYGALLGWLRHLGKAGLAFVLVIVHLVAAAACFSGILPNFS